jgi:hypothetical protein
MTEKNESTSSEPGRPAWAAGLLLSPDMTRASDRRLELTAGLKATMHPILRRLADAETRVAELERQLKQAQSQVPPERDEPDFLIDGDRDMFRRVGGGVYWMQGGNSADWRREELTEPVTELWKEVGLPKRGEPDFLIDGMHEVWERVGADEYACDFYDGGNLNRSQVENRFKPTVAVWK